MKEALEGQSEDNIAEEMDSEDLLFILYTSGSTGKLKASCSLQCWIRIHLLFFFKCFPISEDDIYHCTADIGWITLVLISFMDHC